MGMGVMMSEGILDIHKTLDKRDLVVSKMKSFGMINPEKKRAGGEL